MTSSNANDNDNENENNDNENNENENNETTPIAPPRATSGRSNPQLRISLPPLLVINETNQEDFPTGFVPFETQRLLNLVSQITVQIPRNIN